MKKNLFAIKLLLVLTLYSFSGYSQLNVEGKYNIIQVASKGKLRANDGTVEIKSLGGGRFEMTECHTGYPCEKTEYFTLDGNKVKYESGSSVVLSEFKENGNILYTYIYALNHINYAFIASKVGATTKTRISKGVISDTNPTRKCVCCGKEFKKLNGYFAFKEGNNWGIFSEKQDLLQKGKGKYSCSEQCAQKHSLNECK